METYIIVSMHNYFYICELDAEGFYVICPDGPFEDLDEAELAVMEKSLED